MILYHYKIITDCKKFNGDLACFQRQKLYWNIIPLNQEIGIEIINFWKSRVVTPTGGGVYMEFDQKERALKLEEGKVNVN